MRILITGGAGFVGSNLAHKLKALVPSNDILVLDNLRRRGGELNLSSFKAAGIAFFHGDIRNPEDLEGLGCVDLVIDASAEPSVLAGLDGVPTQVVNINLVGTINILNFALKHAAKLIFLSTSRVYSINDLNNIKFREEETRFTISEDQLIPGVTRKGINESFEVMGPRSLYGATKLASELLIQEYCEFYGLQAIVNRCGVIAGPGQLGKVDQGVIVLWVARHYWKKPLAYFGYGGTGKQVRDALHIDDLFDLISTQIENFNVLDRGTFNVGGSNASTISLCELTQLCEQVVGNSIKIDSHPENRIADIRIYISDNHKIQEKIPWQVTRKPIDIVMDVFTWIQKNESTLEPILK